MAHNTINQLVSYIQSACTNFTAFTSSFATGEIDDDAIDGNEVYPRFYLEQPYNITIENNRYIFKLAIIGTDKIAGSGSLAERLEKQNLMFDCLNDLMFKFERDRVYIFQYPYDMLSISEYSDNDTEGMRVEFTLITVRPSGSCNQIRN